MGNPKKPERVLGPYLDPRGRYRVCIVRADGLRAYQNFKSQAAAEAFREEALAELKNIAGRSVEMAIGEYELYLRDVKKNRPRTVETTLYRLGAMFPDAAGMSVSRLKPIDGQRLYDELQAAVDESGAARYAVASHRNTLNQSRTFAKWCVKKKYMPVNCFNEVEGVGKIATGRDKPQLHVNEARAWLDAALPRGKYNEGAVAGMVALVLNLRATEIVERVCRDLDDDGWLLWVPEAKSDAGRRRLEIPPMLRPFLLRLTRHKAPTDFLFGDGKRPHGRDWVRYWTVRICKLSGVPRTTAHGMRRTHATLATEAGATGAHVAAALGHATPAVTSRHYIARGTAERVQRGKVLDVLSRLQGKRKGPRRKEGAPAIADDEEETGK